MTADATSRQRALDPAASFLVQAPAGSGKTELLVQRFLRLLAGVDAPEEVVALTFTRKAAAEMRNRISAALLAAQANVEPASDHEAQTLDLARAALAQDAEQKWGLCQHPSRLRVQTLDALCASITRQMPMLSAFGAQPGITDDAQALYMQAAQLTLAELERGHHWSNAIDRLLTHLNNDLERLAALLAQMLGRRDQWQRFVIARNDPRRRRENLEIALQGLVEAGLQEVHDHFPADELNELASLARFAAEHLPAESDSSIRSLRNMRRLPDTSLDGFKQWQGINELLLTKGGEWRKAVRADQGFPPAKAAGSAAEKALFAENKEALVALIERCDAYPAFQYALATVPELPPTAYSEDQWQVLAALFEMLQLAAANLQLVFSEQGSVDFTEMAARASHALGDDDTPTDLGLALDYRIQHLLVDEFQDTSLSQFRLLEQLVAGWQAGDGRSLFLVGDPMQSIYRFRQAEVGLYLRVKTDGLGGVPLEFCRLSANFRSQPAVIDWINKGFPAVMPKAGEEDPTAGAISYTPADAQREAGQGGVHIHAFVENDLDREAQHVAKLVEQSRRSRPKATVAILVRSRRHVAHLLPQLKAQGQRFQAVEIEALGQRPVVHDLLALTRSLLHPADRLSWLAIVRAPWCGLELADLLTIAGEEKSSTIWQCLQSPELCAAITGNAVTALERFCEVMSDTLQARGRLSLRRWVEGCWLALGGPGAVADATALQEAQVFFDLLDELDEGGDLADFGRLSDRVDSLFAPPDPDADPRLQIMTIHRAKGLEFDVVVVPGLGRSPASQTQPLLFWMEVPGSSKSSTKADTAELLLAPIAGAGEQKEPIYQYLKKLDKVKLRYEEGRLLYVAATRARDTLHLLGHLPDGKNGPGNPASGSLLERLWPAVESEFMDAISEDSPTGSIPDSVAGKKSFRRLAASWQMPPLPADVAPGGAPWSAAAGTDDEKAQVEYFWAGPDVRHVGTVVHEVLMRIGQDGLANWDRARIEAMKPAISARLTALGIASERVGKRAIRVINALTRTLADERGRWILQAHTEAVCEQALTGVVDGALVNVVLDRSFVDEQGQRWIVDYKTGSHEGGDIDQFLNREQARYAPQLERYAALIAQMEDRPIKLALYFPMLAGWREWAALENP